MAGVFPTAGSPTGSTPALVSAVTGIGFPSITLSRDYVKLRFYEPDVPYALNQRWLGMPRGVYLGFEPHVESGSKVLTLNVDSVNHFSLLKVPSARKQVMIDLFTDSAVELDFSAHTVWPVYVMASATYDRTAATQGKIFTRASGPSSVSEVLICKVDSVDGELVLSSESPTTSQPPVAFSSQPYGYMPSGSVESLADALSSVAEVIDARDSVYTGPYTTLKGRIDSDASGEEIANRLGLRSAKLISNVHPLVSGSTINVSGSFSDTQRTFEPLITITPFGDESTEGALTDGIRNFCSVIATATGYRLTDTVSGEPVYGVLGYQDGTIGGAKEIRFVNASTAITGNGTNPFVSPLAVGDLVSGPDGLFYEIASITDANTASIGSAYRGASSSIFNAAYRRWELSLYTVTGGSYTLSTPTSIQFLFPGFFRTDRAIFNGELLFKRNAVTPPVPSSGATVPGKALLAVENGLAGAVRRVLNSGITAGINIHTLNFVYGGATDGGGGVVNVSVVGAQGPAGEDSNPGPQGPTGPSGFGYNVNNTFELGPLTIATATDNLDKTESHTVNWTTQSPAFAPLSPRSYAHTNGGFAELQISSWGGEYLDIDSITAVSQNETRIVYRVVRTPYATGTRISCFLGASQ